MRKVGILFMAVLMMLSLFGCAAKTEENLPIVETQNEQSYPELDGYIHLDYDAHIHSPEDHRAKLGTRLYDDVTIEKLTRDGDKIVFEVCNDAGQKYDIIVGFYPFWTEINAKPLVGEQGRIFFEYYGFNEALVGRLYPFGKIEMSSGEIIESSAFAVTPKEFRDWIAVNGERVLLSEAKSYESSYVLVKVLAGNVQHLDGNKVSFDAYERTHDGFTSIPMTILYDDCPGSEDLTEGNGITIYGYIDEGTFFPVYMEPSDVGFTLDNIVIDHENDM